MVRHYMLSSEDLALINRRRGDPNRLGFALTLCYLRFPGRILGVWGATEQLWNAFHNCSVAPQTPSSPATRVNRLRQPVFLESGKARMRTKWFGRRQSTFGQFPVIPVPT